MKNDVLVKKINTLLQKYEVENPLFSIFWKSLHEADDFYIIGGAIRSIYNNSKPRDLDIIVKSGMKGIIERLSGVSIYRNYYGGYKIDFNGLLVDMWDFESHWAFNKGILPADEEYLTESCFFDFDALVYSPTTEYLDIGRYLHAIESRTIDFIKYDSDYIERNPGDLTNVVRAMVAANDFNLSFSTAVAAYIRSFLIKNDFASLKECEYRHYKEDKISFEHYNRILQTVAEI